MEPARFRWRPTTTKSVGIGQVSSLGDFNVCCALEDVLDFISLYPVDVLRGRAHHHRNCFGHLAEVLVGSTRAGNDGLTFPLTSHHHYHPACPLGCLRSSRTYLEFSWSPQGTSDHWPVTLAIASRHSRECFLRRGSIYTLSLPSPSAGGTTRPFCVLREL